MNDIGEVQCMQARSYRIERRSSPIPSGPGRFNEIQQEGAVIEIEAGSSVHSARPRAVSIKHGNKFHLFMCADELRGNLISDGSTARPAGNTVRTSRLH